MYHWILAFRPAPASCALEEHDLLRCKLNCKLNSSQTPFLHILHAQVIRELLGPKNYLVVVKHHISKLISQHIFMQVIRVLLGPKKYVIVVGHGLSVLTTCPNTYFRLR